MTIELFLLGAFCTFPIGVLFGALFTKSVYEPFIKELKESINYWYNYNRTK